MQAVKKIFRGIFSYCTNFNLRNWSYKTVALLGLFIRVLILPKCIPDVFEFFASTMMTSWGLSETAYEIVIRIFLFLIDAIGLSNFFYWLSFASVGNIYSRKTIPAWGSFCYTIYYLSYNVIVLVLIKYFEYWVITLVFVIYLSIVFILSTISKKLYLENALHEISVKPILKSNFNPKKLMPDHFCIRIVTQILSALIVYIVLMIIRSIVF